MELFSLCSILPGPTSTQAIVSMGIKAGGPVLALLTMFVWALPVMAVMGALSFLYQFLEAREISFDVLRSIDPMAVGFIIVAAFRIGRKVVTNKTTAILMACSALVTYFIHEPWIFPALLLCGGLVTILLAKEKDIWNKVPLSPPWGYLALFIAFAIGGLIAVAALILTQASGLTPVNLLATGLSVLLLATRKIPAPLIVLAALGAGVLF